MSDSSRNKARPRTGAGSPVAQDQGVGISIVRTLLATLVAAAGIAWLAVYLNVAQDGEKLTWMGDLGRWNFLIGFGLLFIGLSLFANPGTPLGRGRGVVVGMLGSFLIGLVWIIVYYLSQTSWPVPSLGPWNIMVGFGIMFIGFLMTTRWR